MFDKQILIDRSWQMKLNPTPCEKIFKRRLELAGIKFRTQRIIGYYIVDFLIQKTVVELDGSSHDDRELYDITRDQFLRNKGYRVIRIQNRDVEKFDISKLKRKNKHKPFNKITSSSDPNFPGLNWNIQRKILQKERLYGK